ncbi:ABC transporter permease [Pseudomarimonas arenosa]|uniref:Transport permease protein n=1 Tax=Pseudomarimonas arenosa TaxID=2774145 RepID=A0AAW3ZGV5_9GAMM|nr:ABC transporter permease [Pseudomarimonas arenosa]MBD8525256.1 ABC transporter permease [Pseudomarimonas arenosa]
MNLFRLWAIILKELRQLRRDRLSFAMIVGIPTLQLLLFGFAINLDVRGLHAATLDLADTSESRALIADFAATGVVDFQQPVYSLEHLNSLMRLGEISLAVVIPADFSRRVQLGDRPALQIIVDGSDQAVQASARQLAAYPVGRADQWRQQVSPIEILNRYNPERRAPLNTVPALIGVILTMTMVLFTAVALVRERERGNLELLIATPVSPWELTLGKVLPFILIGLIQVSLVLMLGRFVFEVPIRGSLADVYIVAAVFILASLSLGVFLSTLARTQFQAMQLAFFTFLPQILLSGFMFPFAGMPRAAQIIAEALPLTHFVRLIRAIMLRGTTVGELRHELLALGLFAAGFLLASTLRIRKRLD